MQPPSRPPPATLSGVLERIIYHNEENHFTIAELRPDAEVGDGRRPEPVTVVGALPGVECGETLHLSGEWTRHAQHGAQFKVGGFTSELPGNVYGIRKYLGSGLVAGIGKTYANKIVDAFGTDTFRVLSEESGRLRDVEGIGPKRASAIKRAWDEKRTERELYIFLQTYGVTPSQCTKLVKQYGDKAKDVVQRDPYRAAREIEGIGFKTADRIAINAGFANDAPPRVDAGILFALETLQEDGHTAYPETELVEYTAELLNTPRDGVMQRVGMLVANEKVRRVAAMIQLPPLERAERRIAESLRRVAAAPSGLPPIKIDAALVWAEQKAGFAFHPLQRDGVHEALRAKVSLLTGGPGTGKTTCLRALVSVLTAKRVRVHLAAPTGRAAQRLAEATGGTASTIHRLLAYDPAAGGFSANEAHPLATDFLVIDEASMLDTRLAASLFSALPAKSHLLLVGDTDQLPSVGAGNVLKDLIATGNFPVTRLDAVYRQTGHSQIVATAHAINAGDTRAPERCESVAAIPPGAEFVFLVANSAEDALAKVVTLCRDRPAALGGFDPIADVQVLAPMHKGVAGVANLNAGLQAALNRASRSLRAGGVEYRPGDKVIQLRNNYDKNLFNGDIGRILEIDTEAAEAEADFDGQRHVFTRAELGDVGLAYAISIHKSQGSEYPVVIVPLLKQHFMMLQRNLLYTAITRARRKVILVGEPAAYGMAVRNNEARRRHTDLQRKLTISDT